MDPNVLPQEDGESRGWKSRLSMRGGTIGVPTRRAGGMIDVSTAQILHLENSSLKTSVFSNLRSFLPYFAW